MDIPVYIGADIMVDAQQGAGAASSQHTGAGSGQHTGAGSSQQTGAGSGQQTGAASSQHTGSAPPQLAFLARCLANKPPPLQAFLAFILANNPPLHPQPASAVPAIENAPKTATHITILIKRLIANLQTKGLNGALNMFLESTGNIATMTKPLAPNKNNCRRIRQTLTIRQDAQGG